MPDKYVKLLVAAALGISAGTVANAQTVTKTITVPNLPEHLAADPFTDRIYVAVPNFGAKPFDYLTVINGRTDDVIANIEIPPYAYAVAVDPVGHKVYVGGTSEDESGVDKSDVVVVSSATNTYERKIHVSNTTGDGILGLAFDLVSGDLWVANGSDNEIDEIKPGSSNVHARIPLSAEPYGVAVDPITNRIYVALLDGSVSIINGATKAIIATTVVPPTPPLTQVANAGIAVDILTGKVYTTNATFAESSSVGVLGAKGNFITNIAVGNTPIGIDVDPLTKLVFVANSQDGTVDAINAATSTVSKSLPVSGLFLTVNTLTDKVYVGANNGSPTVTVITEK
jgi:DNA-binding beta-propeller fold protein YncE